MSPDELSYRLEWVSLQTFRSYDELRWEPEPGVNLLSGRNGAGKTNLLEAISYLASLSSFRGSPDVALVAHGADSAFLRGEVRAGDASSLVEVEIRPRGGRRAFVNRQRLARSADLLGHVRAVAFLPEDLDMVKRGPAYRRVFLDAVAVQLWPGSYLDQMEYERAVRQRNSFLKQGDRDIATLDVWDARVAQAGGKVMARRARTAAALATHLQGAYAAVSGAGAEVRIEYESGWGGSLDPSILGSDFTQSLAASLGRSRKEDQDRKVTTIGPHRDEPIFWLNGHDIRHHGSQGEQRTLALALRLSAHDAITQMTSIRPLLLLDDVFSELDVERSAALARILPRSQVVITTADISEIPLEGALWEVSAGSVMKTGQR